MDGCAHSVHVSVVHFAGKMLALQGLGWSMISVDNQTCCAHPSALRDCFIGIFCFVQLEKL